MWRWNNPTLSKDLTLELPIAIMHPASWSDPPPDFESPLSNLAAQGWIVPSPHPLATAFGSTEQGRSPIAVAGAKPLPPVTVRQPPHRADLLGVKPQGQTGSAEYLNRIEKDLPGLHGGPSKPDRLSEMPPKQPESAPDKPAPENQQKNWLQVEDEERVSTPITSIRNLGGLTQLRVVNPDTTMMSGKSSNLSSLLAIDSVILAGLDEPKVSVLPTANQLHEEKPLTSNALDVDKDAASIPHAAIFVDDAHTRSFFRVPTGFKEPVQVSDRIKHGQSITEQDNASTSSIDSSSSERRPPVSLPDRRLSNEQRSSDAVSTPTRSVYAVAEVDEDRDENDDEGSGLIEFTFEAQPNAQSTVRNTPNVATSTDSSKPSTPEKGKGTLKQRIVKVLGRPPKVERGIEGRKTESPPVRRAYADAAAWPM